MKQIQGQLSLFDIAVSNEYIHNFFAKNAKPVETLFGMAWEMDGAIIYAAGERAYYEDFCKGM